MHPILKLINKPERLIIGLMSGTSCDGLDIALVRVENSGRNTQFSLVHGQTYSYSPGQKKFILNLLHTPELSLQTLSQLNFYLARIWAKQIELFLDEYKIKAADIDLIGSHGQTIWHQPEAQPFEDASISSTLQLGDPSVLAQHVRIPVIGDFRVADVALGGQGAPLIPYFDYLFFSRFKQNIISLNIGGISNVTAIPANQNMDKVQAFDCGPGNMLLDQASKYFFKEPYDTRGLYAKGGEMHTEFFSFLQERDPFLHLAPPKSTGREQYSDAYFQEILKHAQKWNLSSRDLLRNLTEYTAFSIFENYRLFIRPQLKADTLVVAGGGAQNDFLMRRLQHYFDPVPVQPAQHFGLDENFKEAIGFAILANETLHAQPSNIPQATGASRPAVLGKICLV